MEENSDIFNFLMYSLSNDAGFKFSSYCKKFNKLKTNLQRINFVYRYMEKYKAYYPAFKEDEKSDTEATKLNKQGNEYYTGGKLRDALDCYTMSILNAKSKETRALAYGNRSAVVFKLKLHSETLADIDRAFENNYNYPVESKAKLVARQESAKTEEGMTFKYHHPVPEILESKKNSQIQCANNCIQIMNNEQYGRYIVATRNIEIGEIIAVEPLYCAVIKDEIYIHCHECFELCYNTIPCDKCTKALYCGKTCKDKAFDRYHKYECPILLTLDLFKIDFPNRLALKIVFMSRNEWDVHNSDQLETTEYRSDRFKEMYGLLSHIEKRKVENLLARTATACGLFHLIKNQTTFLQDCTSEDRLKEMLLSMVLNCDINTVGLDKLDSRRSKFYHLSPIATAVYTFHSMFNHSCWPNVSRNFYGSSMVLRAINTISKGEQCFVCYGPRCSSHSKDFRQKFLSERKFFTCTCRACEENWPMDDGHVHNIMMKLRTSDFDVTKNELKRILMEFKRTEKLLPPSQNYAGKEVWRYCFNTAGNKIMF